MSVRPSLATAPSVRRTIGNPVPSRLGPWQLVKLLGTGSYCQVFLAAPIKSISTTTADYAIKMVRTDLAGDLRAIAVLQREAFVSRSVSHPHLSCILSAHVDSPPFYLVLPYQPGTTAADLIASGGRLPVGQALWIIRQVAEGLAALHESSWLHGDVKPANIFVAASGHVTLCDLGFAQREKRAGVRSECLCGSPAYLAPEWFCDSTPISAASDIYSLGVAAFQLLTGSLPFTQTEAAELAAAHRLQPPPDPRALHPSLPPMVGRLLRRMLAKEPLRRPTGAELVSLLVDLEIDLYDWLD